MKVKNKKTIVAIAAVLLITVVGVTFAYFQSSASFENLFSVGIYKVVTTEVFESPTNWAPGEEIPKTITTKNEGTIPAAVRVSYTEKWKDKNGTDITSTIDNGTAIINLDNTSEWTKEGNYYYYNYILNPDETTSSFMKSVTLNPALNDVTCTGEGLTKTCEATNSVTGAKYILTLTKETVQAGKYKEVWNTNFEITEKPKPEPFTIGTSINYSTTLNNTMLSNWKVFYSDEDYTYLILGGYLPDNAVSSDFLSEFNNAETLNRENLINAMTSNPYWKSLLVGTYSGNSIDERNNPNAYAMGSPTIELWSQSWNAYGNHTPTYTKYENPVSGNSYDGYYIGTEQNPTTTNFNSGVDDAYGLYFNSFDSGNNIGKPFPNGPIHIVYGYWLASPSAAGEDKLYYVYCALGNVTSTTYKMYEQGVMDSNGSSSGGNTEAFRPVIKLPTSVLRR